MKILMLETMTYGDDISLEQFNRLGEVVTYSLSSYEEAVARMKEHNPDVVIINKTNMNAECMAAAPNLKMVAEAATGYNNIDIEYAKAHGIRVANVAGYSTQSVIQHTFALAFYLIEKMRYYDDFVKSGEYAEWPCFSHFANVFHELAGKTWGIVGLGNIGRGVAKIAADFGCNVIYYSASGHSYDVPYERYELDEFLKKSDIVSIHAPLNKYMTVRADVPAVNLEHDESFLNNRWIMFHSPSNSEAISVENAGGESSAVVVYCNCIETAFMIAADSAAGHDAPPYARVV